MTELSIGTKIEHPKFGQGIVIDDSDEYSYNIYFGSEHGEKEISKRFDGFVLIKLVEKDKNSVSLDEIKKVLQDIIEPLTEPIEDCKMADKWENGNLILQPFDKTLQSKEIPIDGFFHKIVMLRDRLRVMEQQINAHKVLSEEDKINLQQYITRIYGTLTTFNVLFKNKEQWFVGEKSD